MRSYNRKAMSAIIETAIMNCDKDFQYEIEYEYWPHLAVAFASYQGTLISSTELNKLRTPFSDSDYEWERYEQLLEEWKDEARTNLDPDCKLYINNGLSFNHDRRYKDRPVTDGKPFICTSCDQEWPNSFLATVKWVFPTDEMGFESEEPELIEVCGNCHGPTVCAGMEAPETNGEDDDDLPF